MKTIEDLILSDIQLCPPFASADFYELLLRFGFKSAGTTDHIKSHVFQMA
ncbi:MAG: hypothetical protein JXB19_08670 [Bacteroidales bacterium]|nr:hypothetical protein [Bacteroidales bacterium]